MNKEFLEDFNMNKEFLEDFNFIAPPGQDQDVDNRVATKLDSAEATKEAIKQAALRALTRKGLSIAEKTENKTDNIVKEAQKAIIKANLSDIAQASQLKAQIKEFQDHIDTYKKQIEKLEDLVKKNETELKSVEEKVKARGTK